MHNSSAQNSGSVSSVSRTENSETISMYRSTPGLSKILGALEDKETWTLSEEDAERIFNDLALLSQQYFHFEDSDSDRLQEDLDETRIFNEEDLNSLNVSMSYMQARRGMHILRLFCKRNPDLPENLIWQARTEAAGNHTHAATAQIFLNRMRILMVYNLFDAIFDSRRIEFVKKLLQ